MTVSDFHHTSISLHERLEGLNNAAPNCRTWFVRTTAWEQQAINSTELVDLIDEALEEGLIPSVELC